ncbi:MAG: virulence protein RhuM/Fic/DOC family protein [Patescibacteria group bacterium]
MKKRSLKNGLVIYQAKSGAIELRGDVEHETLWANRMQMARMFGVNPQAITKHIQNIYKEKELDRKATSSKMELVQDESGRKVKRQVDIYNLDMLIAVGYRINSVVGTRFRQWATKTLREHIVRGYTLNRKRIGKNYEAFMKSVTDVQALLPEHVTLDPKAILDLIKEFSSTWVSLDAYDKGTLTSVGTTRRTIKLTGVDLTEAIRDLRSALIDKGEATDIFAQEKNAGSIEGIVGNVMQSLGGKAVYPTVEEKAAHLLYFMVKNHPFVDGNKRSGAFAFVWFLRKTKVKAMRNMNPGALTALTLLIAESDPQKKDQMVALVTRILN